jgi:pimeloyl-ACP methyl ester carboxylesterase
MTWQLCQALAAFALVAQTAVSIPTTNGVVEGDLYGSGDRAIALVAHGGYSSRAAWQKPAQALAEAGFRVLAFETRAAVELRAGRETDCLYDARCMAEDVLAVVRYLRRSGATTVAVVGGSAGGGAAAQASIEAAPGEIDRLVLLAPMVVETPDKIKGRKVFITSRDDRGSGDELRLPGIRDQYEKAPGPKKWVVLEGSAHGQRIFDTPKSESLMREIRQFLSER